MNTFFTSDTHFFHNNVIKYSNRPFLCVEEMNETMINNWNRIVKNTDQVYHLGDVSFGTAQQTIEILERLRGRKFLIQGNHDKHIIKKIAHCFEWVKNTNLLTIQGKPNNQLIWLSHYSHRVWPQKHYGVIHLFGHSHGTLTPYNLSFDVGVDCWNYTPISLEQVNKKVSELKAFGYGVEDKDRVDSGLPYETE